MSKREQLQQIIQEKAIFKDNFVLTSGQTSTFLFDLKPIMLESISINLIADLILEKIQNESIDAIGGLELGAIPLSVAVSLKSLDTNPISSFFIRKNIKGHSSNKLIEGNLNLTMNIMIIEDVANTGGSILKAANTLRENGINIFKAITIVDRLAGATELLSKNNIDLLTIFNINDFNY